VLLLCSAAVPLAAYAASATSALERAVRDVCDKEVVLLGEDGAHGSGQTLEIKVELITRLIDRCGFSAVAFESQIYDFLDLERSFATSSATPAQLADAIGGLWSTTREIEPLVSYLFERAARGQVRLVGLDPQVGGATQHYSQALLPRELSEYLESGRRQGCAEQLKRLTNYRYDAATPYDETARERLRACATEIQTRAEQQPDRNGAVFAARMAINLSRYLDMSSGDTSNVRDRAMFDNLMWHRSRFTAGVKTIVWCATVHATKQAPVDSKLIPIGLYVHQVLGARAAAIGFSALTGSYGRRNQTPTILATAPPGALEARSLQDLTGDIAYIGAAELKKLGEVAARTVSYSQFITARWDQLLDGIIVLRQERPPEYVRSAKPQQATQ
jgi:erythromycin esterase-like protein